MDALDPKKAAVIAYSQAAQIRGMVAQLRGLYDSYNAPEEDRVTGGKYAIGRLICLADAALADDVLPALQAAAVALVKYADLLEVAALAIGDNPSWWKETAADLLAAAKENPAGFGILASEGRFGLGRMEDDLLDPDNLVAISSEEADDLRGLGVYFHNFDGEPKPVAGKLEDGESPF